MDAMTLIGAHAALMASIKSGLLDILEDEALSSSQCAQRLGLDQRACDHVLDVLTALHLLTCDGDAYRLAERSPAAKASPYSWNRMLLIGQQFEHTGRMLKTGEPLAFMDESAAQREASYHNLVNDMGVAFADAATRLASQLTIRPLSIIDVGCGSGVWSLAIAANNPQSQVTGLDLPKVLNALLTRAKALGMEARSTLLPGDMHHVELPQAHYDLAVIANVLRLEAPEKARQLVARVGATVRPGGSLLIVDALASGTPEKDLLRAVYALHLALRTGTGRIHSQSEISGWMSEAGFGELTSIDLGAQLGAVAGLIGRR